MNDTRNLAENLIRQAEEELRANVCPHCGYRQACDSKQAACVYSAEDWRGMVAEKALDMVRQLDHISDQVKNHVITWIEKTGAWKSSFDSLDEMLSAHQVAASTDTIASYETLKKALPWVIDRGIITEQEALGMHPSRLRLIAGPLKKAMETGSEERAAELLGMAESMKWQTLRRALYKRAGGMVLGQIEGERFPKTIRLVCETEKQFKGVLSQLQGYVEWETNLE